jgi:hypothetical protein
MKEKHKIRVKKESLPPLHPAENDKDETHPWEEL